MRPKHHLLISYSLFLLMKISFAIHCNEVIDRARDWVNRGIPYSMERYTSAPGGGSYRTDCSGFVSMAWKLSTSLSTVSLPNVAHQISRNDLQRGDIILKGGPGTGGANGHVLIFERWENDAHTSYWAYEMTEPRAHHVVITNYPYYGRGGYTPYRYGSISCDAPPLPAPAPAPAPSGDCICNKGNALGEFCGHELDGNCIKEHIYGCNRKGGPPSIHYGPCKLGCIGSDNSHAHCRK